MADEIITGNENIIPQSENTLLQSAETPVPQETGIQTEQVDRNREGKYNEILSKVTPGQQNTSLQITEESHQFDAKSISEAGDEASKVQKLIELAQAKGVVYAVKVARSLEDYYVLDTMHDELVDKLYEELLTKGLISKD